MAAAAAAAAVASTTAAAASATTTAATAPTTQHPGKRRRTDGASSWRKDTQAGFFLAEEDDGPGGGPREAHTTYQAKELAPEIDNPFYPAHPKCSDCGVEFWNSQLQVQFGVMVCDACHKKHKDGKCVSSLGLSLCTNQDRHLCDNEKNVALLLSLQELAVTPGVCVDMHQPFKISPPTKKITHIILRSTFSTTNNNHCTRRYSLVTKTAAKADYLLREADLGGQPDSLWFIEKYASNPAAWMSVPSGDVYARGRTL